MRKLVTVLALGLFITGGAYAQEGVKKEKKQRTERAEARENKNKQVKAKQATRGDRSARQAEKLSEQLGLTEVQKNQLQAINMKRAQEMQALNAKYDKSDARNEAQRAERKAIQDKWQADLRSILDEKQYAAYEADRQEKRENFRKSGREKVRAEKRVLETRQNQKK